MVEGALVFLPTIAMVLAIIDFSVAIFVQNLFYNAVREGVRFGITSQTCSGLGHDACIKSVVQRYSMGFLNGTNANYIEIRYFDPVTGAYVNGAGSNAAGNILEIRVNRRPWSWIAPVWRPGSVAFSAQSSDVMEGQPNGPPAR